MNALFLKVLNMSAAASWLIGAVVLLRLALKRSPRWAVCLLWAVVAVRLVCPFSFESRASLVPSAEVLPPAVITERSFEIRTGIGAIDTPVNEYLEDRYYEGVTVPANNGADTMNVLGWIWAAGMTGLGGWGVFSYQRLRKRLETAVRLRDNIFQSEYADSPFVMGFWKPRIYLPYGMEPGEMVHVIAHEEAHIARLDHWWKPLGYTILVLHWFNPLVWLGYSLFCRDLELACDERAVRELDGPERAEYTEALLHCSGHKRAVTACPLAFGEVGVKERVRSILHYRKPAFWAIGVTAAVCMIVGVCFLTDPEPSRYFELRGDSISDLEPARIVERITDVENVTNSGVYMNSNNFQLQLNADFTWQYDQTVSYFYYEHGKVRSGQLRIFPEEGEYFLTETQQWQEQDSIYLLRNYLDAVKYLPQVEIAALCPGAEGYILHQMEEGTPADYERVITYGPGGAGEIDGWLIHLQLQPLWDGHGTGADVVDVFYSDRVGNGGEFCWFDRNNEAKDAESVTLDAFPGVSFRTAGGRVFAEVTDPETGETGGSMLLSGMPITDAFFCDVTGDGYPDICATSYFGSGMIDERIQVCDYANQRCWELQDRGTFDYRFREEGGRLVVERRRYMQEQVLDTLELLCEDGVLMLDDGTVFQGGPPRITGEVTGYQGSYLLVRPVYGTKWLSPDTEYCVELGENLKVQPPEKGDTVVVSYDGTVREIYPPVLSGADVLYVMRSTATEPLTADETE